MHQIIFHEEADFKTLEAARYYEERAVDLGLTFLDEVEKSTQHDLSIFLYISKNHCKNN